MTRHTGLRRRGPPRGRRLRDRAQARHRVQAAPLIPPRRVDAGRFSRDAHVGELEAIDASKRLLLPGTRDSARSPTDHHTARRRSRKKTRDPRRRFDGGAAPAPTNPGFLGPGARLPRPSLGGIRVLSRAGALTRRVLPPPFPAKLSPRRLCSFRTFRVVSLPLPPLPPATRPSARSPQRRRRESDSPRAPCF